jgi:pimeloyl-ACP methyl ester carboxylesterase
MSTERGAQAVTKDWKAFARIMWETWAPQGWFRESEFETTAKSFENPDWPGITVHSYRVRWAEAEKDPRYAALDAQLLAAQSISVPALMIQGGADGVTLADTTAGKGQYFTAGYTRHVLDGVGHFPTREAAERVNKLLLEFLQK